MAPRSSTLGEYEYVHHDSDSDDFELDEHDFQSNGLLSHASHVCERPFSRRVYRLFAPLIPRRWSRNRYRRKPQRQVSPAVRPWRRRRCLFWLYTVFALVVALIALTPIFNPSYTTPPAHYRELKDKVLASGEEGRANPENQKIFIAASIYDKGGHLLKGAWGKAVLDLIELLGNENVYLSIYENDDDPAAVQAQADFKEEITFNHSIVCDSNFVMADVPHVELPDGSRRVKRIAYLAEVRNKALDPLEEEAASIKFNRVLYVNDVIFDPIDAVQLLFSTNRGEDGRPSYKAACALDFVNPFKFYDTFASRDAEGFSMGVPFFPWFASAGNAISRQDVLEGRDAIRVKSCWGGMVAFDARPFQASEPLRFRAAPDLYWDASECCLIHADLTKDVSDNPMAGSGVYVNPFVRVAYSERTLKWLPFTRKFERMYSIPQAMINRLVGLPWHNPRRAEEAGAVVSEKAWVPNGNLESGGSFEMVERKAGNDGYCGRRGLQLIREAPRSGEKNWESIAVPSG